jgi:hypothetical protein
MPNALPIALELAPARYCLTASDFCSEESFHISEMLTLEKRRVIDGPTHAGELPEQNRLLWRRIKPVSEAADHAATLQTSVDESEDRS